ncbi:hypothetical protein YSY43_22780 [Paenibacillus sp. YSY-4.3]
MTEDGTTIIYNYNGDGLMVGRTKGNHSTRYYYDDRGLLVAEGTVSSGAVTITYGYVFDSIGKLVGRQAAGESKLQYYVTNGHGDVTELRDASGKLLNSYNYDIWGNPITVQETVPNSLGYAGEYWDADTKLQYLRARWYDPAIARFIGEDTYEGELTNPLSLNLYTYVYNNPLKYFDPTGNDAVIITAKWGALGGGHTSLLLQNAAGDWYYTFYGDTKVVSEKVDSKAMGSLTNLNAWLQQDTSSIQYYDKKYTSSTYIKGDFTGSLDYLRGLAQGYSEKYGTDKNKDYNLFLNNCVEVSWRALQKGSLTDGTKIGDFVQSYPNDLIPNKFAVWAKGEFKNNAYTYKSYSQQIQSFIQDNERKSGSGWYNLLYGKDTFLENIKIGKQLFN